MAEETYGELIKTSVYLDRDDVNFLKENGFSISLFARKTIKELMKNPKKELNAPSPRNPMTVSIWLPQELIEFVRKRGVNLSALLRSEIARLKELLS